MTKYTCAAILVSLVTALHVGCSSTDAGGSGGNTGDDDDGSSDDGSSDDGSSDDGSSDDDGSSSGDTTGPSSGSASTTGGSTTGAGGGGSECGALPTWDECDTCECAKNSAGCDAWYVLEDEHCYCGASAPCAQACAGYCGGADWDAACDACVEMLDDACYEAAYNACTADPECLAFSDATDASCENLPDE